jgi:hypothetical protein
MSGFDALGLRNRQSVPLAAATSSSISPASGSSSSRPLDMPTDS